ncbi:MAG: isochorismate synthase [Dietzia sp.]|uniref:isochorismate synthase n=1 Tax=Dietzia TaxID=37914 RepID=UPI0015FBFEF5|nr:MULTISPECIES: isochorismate synthase [Dietzia]MBB1055155.1 isochorismate synthase [Dietzia sp. B44]MBB1056509.1 isochorismate synthase [Dietzia sp. B19]MBC7295817.1 isochorismate synthase [Dietzia sp.]MCT1513832.1 isochorismate synthase [Dietzia cercidiphylli]MDO8393259.1 isochorismate synthase [Dietzia sp.]
MASGPHPDAARPVTAPDFLLSRHTGSLRTQGSLRVFPDPADAALALRSGRCGLVVGAIGFEPDAPAALVEPDIVVRTDGPLEPPAYFRSLRTRARVVEELPSTEAHRRRVATAIAGIRAGGLDKVVLARAVRLLADDPIDPHAVCAALIDSSPSADGFLVDLSPAGGVHSGRILVGSSPELLVRRRGDVVECHPLAGSAPRSRDTSVDQAAGRALQASGKDAAEHAFVVDSLATALAPLCRDLQIPERPSLTSTREMWHLGTRIRGRVADPRTTALDLALAVHPTPAVCGTPTDEARRVIAGLEGRRGFYSGAVGWADAGGDGDWMVTIRCAEIDADRSGAIAWAGGGLVADSDPDDEVAETAAKLRTVLTALGAV